MAVPVALVAVSVVEVLLIATVPVTTPPSADRLMVDGPETVPVTSAAPATERFVTDEPAVAVGGALLAPAVAVAVRASAWMSALEPTIGMSTLRSRPSMVEEHVAPSDAGGFEVFVQFVATVPEVRLRMAELALILAPALPPGGSMTSLSSLMLSRSLSTDASAVYASPPTAPEVSACARSGWAASTTAPIAATASIATMVVRNG
jgi:hypothetical protein